jgi:hypothetical protein
VNWHNEYILLPNLVLDRGGLSIAFIKTSPSLSINAPKLALGSMNQSAWEISLLEEIATDVMVSV